MTTSADIVNRALELIGDQARVSGANPAFDGSTPGNAAGVLYTPTVQLVLRETDPAFARKTASLAVAPGVTPIVPWSREYLYPADCLRLRQVRPNAADTSLNDPLPVRAAVAFDTVAGSPVRVILTNQADALAVYTSSAPTEDQWDAVFAETVARRLANPLALALAGRPDLARELLEESERYTQGVESLDDL